LPFNHPIHDAGMDARRSRAREPIPLPSESERLCNWLHQHLVETHPRARPLLVEEALPVIQQSDLPERAAQGHSDSGETLLLVLREGFVDPRPGDPTYLPPAPSEGWSDILERMCALRQLPKLGLGGRAGLMVPSPDRPRSQFVLTHAATDAFESSCADRDDYREEAVIGLQRWVRAGHDPEPIRTVCRSYVPYDGHWRTSRTTLDPFVVPVVDSLWHAGILRPMDIRSYGQRFVDACVAAAVGGDLRPLAWLDQPDR
jgi:hypothetical protein